MPSNISLTTYPEIRPSSLSLCQFWRCFSLCLGREGESWNRGTVEIYIQLWKCTLWLPWQKKKSSTQLNLSVSHTQLWRNMSLNLFFLLDWHCWLLQAASSLCHMRPSAFALEDLKSLSRQLCPSRWMDTNAGQRGLGASICSNPPMEQFPNPSRRGAAEFPSVWWVAGHGEWLPALGFSCPEPSPPGWSLSLLSSSAGLYLSS